MLNREEWALALEDIRTRQQAGLETIRATDQQAMSLLALYVTLASAAASAGVAALASDQILFPRILSAPLLLAALAFAIGRQKCFRAMKLARIGVPGRSPDFWRWAALPEIAFEEAMQSYLKNAEEMYALNTSVNREGAFALNTARLFGLAAPVVGVVLALLLMLSELLLTCFLTCETIRLSEVIHWDHFRTPPRFGHRV
jgi:hypothetical protein